MDNLQIPGQGLHKNGLQRQIGILTSMQGMSLNMMGSTIMQGVYSNMVDSAVDASSKIFPDMPEEGRVYRNKKASVHCPAARTK